MVSRINESQIGINNIYQTGNINATNPVNIFNNSIKEVNSIESDALTVNNPAKVFSMVAPSEIDKLYLAELEKVSHVQNTTRTLPDFSVTPFRIGLAVDQKQVEFANNGGKLILETAEGRQEIADLGSSSVKVKNENGSLAVYKDNTLVGTYTGKLIVEGNDSVPSVINGKKYRGGIEVIVSPTNSATLTAINTVLLEDYLKGVVPAESSASWPMESLKAQSMAARTYAISNWKNRDALGFDLYPTVSDQVYKGMEIEQPSSTKAVESTNGRVIMYNGKPINALFFACSGGITDSAKEVWGIDLPYIQPVKDFDQNAPKNKWKKTVTNAAIKDAIKQLGVNIGDIKEIIPTKFTEAGRVKQIKFIGTEGDAVVDSNKFRFAIVLNSTFWEVTASDEKKFSLNQSKAVPKTFTFDGKGWGHGLGMSQWGAKQMAVDGKTGDEIIKHYYTGVEIGSLYKNINKE